MGSFVEEYLRFTVVLVEAHTVYLFLVGKYDPRAYPQFRSQLVLHFFGRVLAPQGYTEYDLVKAKFIAVHLDNEGRHFFHGVKFVNDRVRIE